MEQHAGSESTLYLVLCTWYNEKKSCYLILATCPPRRVMSNIERRLENEEVEIRKPHESRNTTQ
jgi:hypothetical protein